MSDKFEIILADPPWSFRVWNKDTGNGRSAISHYPTMTREELRLMPVADVAAKNCVLFLWATFPVLKEAIELGEAWGFTYKTVAFTWVKITKHGKKHVGMGYWTRANPEPVLFFTRGKPQRVSKAVRQLQEHSIGRHSEKPVAIHDEIIKLMGDKPRIEFFARQPRPGWVTMGNEIDGLPIQEALRQYVQNNGW